MFESVANQKNFLQRFASVLGVKGILYGALILTAIAYLFFGRTIAQNFDLLVSSNYAPYFDLQTLTDERWTVEKRNTARHKRPEYNSNYTLKSDARNADLLLFRCNFTDLVFSYNVRDKKLTTVPLSVWHGASGEAASDFKHTYFDSDKGDFSQSVSVSYPKADSQKDGQDKMGKFGCPGKLDEDCIGGVKAAVHGRYAGGIMPSPDRRLAVIASIDGPVTAASGFLIGAPQLRKGFRYLELFQISDQPASEKPQVQKIGRTIKIYDPIESEFLELAWSQDGNFIVVSTKYDSIVSVVSTQSFTEY